MPSVTAADSRKLRKILAKSVMAIAGIFCYNKVTGKVRRPTANLQKNEDFL